MARGKTDRAADERLIAMLQLRQRGLTLRQIAARFMMSYPGVDKLTKQVRDHDLTYSGEPQHIVSQAYWQEGRW